MLRLLAVPTALALFVGACASPPRPNATDGIVALYRAPQGSGVVSCSFPIRSTNWRGYEKPKTVVRLRKPSFVTEPDAAVGGIVGGFLGTDTETCGSDEVGSVALYNVPVATVIRLFDDSHGRPIDDWIEIYVKTFETRIVIPTIEDDYEDDWVRVTYFAKDGFAGDVAYASAEEPGLR